MDLDEKDLKLLSLLQQDARVTNTELAQKVDLSPPGLQKRLRKLEDAGIVQQYTTYVDRTAVGYDMLCFVQISLEKHGMKVIEQFRQEVSKLPEVLECHYVTGEGDYLLKVVVRNRKHLESFLMKTLADLPAVDRMKTSIVLGEIKETLQLPVGENRYD